MTSDHPSATPTDGDDAHLDAEALSAAVDGEASSTEQAHLERCPTCRQQVEELTELHVRMAQPPPPVPRAVREAAISAALDHFEEGAPESATTRAAHRSRRPSRRLAELAPWLAAAAVVLLVALSLPLVLSVGGTDDAETAASDSAVSGPSNEAADDSAAAGAAAPEAAATSPSDEAVDDDSPGTVADTAQVLPVDVGDLGNLATDADLGPVVDQALGTTSAFDAADSLASEDGDDAGDDSVADRVPSDTTGGPEGEFGESQDDVLVPKSERAACVERVRDVLEAAGDLVLRGTATVEDRAAVVLGFGPDERRRGVLLVLAATEGCDVLGSQTYATG